MDTHEQIQGNVYSNTVLRFAIRFPEDWKIKDGDGQAVIKQAFGPNRAAINLTVFQGSDALLALPKVTDKTLTALLDSASQSLIIQLAGRVLERSIGEINGLRTAYCIVAATDLDHTTGRTPMVFHHCLAVKHGLVYMITACMRESDREAVEPLVRDSMASFIIGD